jgi:hypothetical protein
LGDNIRGRNEGDFHSRQHRFNFEFLILSFELFENDGNEEKGVCTL